MTTPQMTSRTAWPLLALLLMPLACDNETSSVRTQGVAGHVTLGDGTPVVGAQVYLVPASRIDLRPISSQGVLDGTTEDFDEPLEDAVRAHGDTMLTANSDASGAYSVGTEISPGDYCFYVQASTEDEHLPGGDQSRVS